MAGSMLDLEVLMNKNRPYRQSPLFTMKTGAKRGPALCGKTDMRRQSFCPHGA